ncbi:MULTISPECIES: putative ABC transporter permease [Bacillaceae]|uniref:ABC transporter permease n=1 Tax=Evansella alkalicola TaxID=745819 RepID=A0ABS6JVR0_9BACI|nr:MULTISPECIES: putative ABC transporter permease [Bacillaceae]MBU9721215.1 putative ABC transporter permease [Bacillus alkalicola]
MHDFISFVANIVLNFWGIEVLLFYFFLYSFVGWLIENIYSRITTRVFFKEGFLYSPLKPMYGFTPVLLLLTAHFDLPIVFIILACFIIPTFVEYVSGVMLQTFFRKKWWDYTDMPYQFQGHITLSFSLCWFALCLVFLFVIHREVESLYFMISTIWVVVYPVFMVGLMLDFIFTVSKHRRNKPVQFES